MATYDSTAASWKDWAFKFENMEQPWVPSSRDTLDWAAQQDTPILNFDDVEVGPDSVRNQSFKSTLHWQNFWREGGIGHCAEHDTRRKFGSLAETREKV